MHSFLAMHSLLAMHSFLAILSTRSAIYHHDSRSTLSQCQKLHSVEQAPLQLCLYLLLLPPPPPLDPQALFFLCLLRPILERVNGMVCIRVGEDTVGVKAH
jgi:hypothetical protein